MVRPAARSRALLLVTLGALVAQGGEALSQTPGDANWCGRCIVFQGDIQIAPSTFDLRFDNRCGVPIYFNYKRLAGDNNEPKADERFTELIAPGEQVRRCSGSRTWRCTPISTYAWGCTTPPQNYRATRPPG